VVRYKKTLYFLFRLCIGVGLVFFLFWRVGVIEVLSKLKQIEPFYIILSIFLFFSAVLIISLRWKVLLDAHAIHVPFNKTVAFYLVGFFFNNFLPTVIGLDIIRAVYVSNTYGKRTECFASVISEKVIGILGILLLGIFFLPLFIVKDRFIIYIFSGLLLLAILFLAGIFFFPKRGRLRGISWLFKPRILKSLKERLSRLYDALYYYKDRRFILFQTLVLSVVYQIILISIFFFIGRSLSVTIPYYYYLAFIPVINIGSMIPLTPNGIGIRESLCVYLFGLAGVDSSNSILLSILFFGIALLVSLAGAGIFIFGIRREKTSSPKNGERI
jgi:uncharacterized protein (TIRG00374 family)